MAKFALLKFNTELTADQIGDDATLLELFKSVMREPLLLSSSDLAEIANAAEAEEYRRSQQARATLTVERALDPSDAAAFAAMLGIPPAADDDPQPVIVNSYP